MPDLSPVRVTIALGSNLGNRLQHLQRARDLLKNIAVSGEFLQSPVYQTAPHQCPENSPDFFNAVVEFFFVGSPRKLHDQTQAIEFHLGRIPICESNAPRVIDVDILLIGDIIHDDGLLQIPHPRMLDRRFVLEPLSNIRPDAKLPHDQVSIQEHLRHLDSSEAALTLVQAQW
jgi:2-amino-4-hydroxy-6-hydroxymethyldihydropteridine diphosphokinase